MTDEPPRAGRRPVLPYATPEPAGKHRPPYKRYAAMLLIWMALTALSGILARNGPAGAAVGMVCADVFVALFLPLVMGALPPRPISWTAAIVFALATWFVAGATLAQLFDN